MKQAQVKRAEAERSEEAVERVEGADHSDLKNELDALLDEIDDVLEENAEAFVKAYVQHGGE